MDYIVIKVLLEDLSDSDDDLPDLQDADPMAEKLCLVQFAKGA